MNLCEILQQAYPKGLQDLNLSRVDIVSPYISEGFFNQLLELEPKEVFLVVDAGCSERDIVNVKQLLGDILVNDKIRLGKSAGLVHAKLFLFHWTNNQTRSTSQLLIWGS